MEKWVTFYDLNKHWYAIPLSKIRTIECYTDDDGVLSCIFICTDDDEEIFETTTEDFDMFKAQFNTLVSTQLSYLEIK